jgi:monovalent cation/hydrogen antiporter
MQALELVLVLLAATAALAVLADRLAVPPPVLMVLGGAILAVLPNLPRLSLNPDVVFLVFVPPLLYWTAVNTSWRDFRLQIRSISLLSVGLVIATMIVVAVVAHALAPELTWPAAFVLGAIVSPPDPVAVTAVTRKLGIPRTILVILEGEGLVNDATALVAYRMAVAAVVAGGFSLGTAMIRFVWSASVAVVVGLAVGIAVIAVRRRIGGMSVVENTVSILTPFAAFIPAERLGVSGVLAVVTVGLYLGRRGPRVVSARTRIQAYSMWQMVTFLLEGLVFILVGLELPVALAALHERSIGSLVGLAFAVAAAAILIRILWVFPGAFGPGLLLRKLGHPETPPPWRSVAFVSWAGLRGSDSLVIALALPLTVAGGKPFPGRDLILFLTFAVIFVTLVLQGLTLKAVIRLLRLKPGPDVAEEEIRARDRAAAAGLAALEKLPGDDVASREARAALEEKYRHRSHRYAARLRGARHQRDEDRTEAYRRMRLGMIEAERDSVVKLRDENVISDDVLRNIQRDLDLEQVLLESPEASLTALEGAAGRD